MSVRPRDLLDQAKSLQSGAGEVSARGSISRAYYAALHRALEIVPQGVGRDDERNTHQQVIDAVDRLGRGIAPGRQAAIQIGRLLRQLRKSRVLADYQLAEDLSPDEAETAIGRAEKLFGLCSEVERLRQQPASPK